MTENLQNDTCKSLQKCVFTVFSPVASFNRKRNEAKVIFNLLRWWVAGYTGFTLSCLFLLYVDTEYILFVSEVFCVGKERGKERREGEVKTRNRARKMKLPIQSTKAVSVGAGARHPELSAPCLAYSITLYCLLTQVWVKLSYNFLRPTTI